jgi:hypothetical protein
MRSSQAPPPPFRFVAISPDDGGVIDLRDPWLAAALSWAVPGLGQLYQGRTFKGWLFMATILGTFLAGMVMGDWKVVYVDWRRGQQRWAYVCQAGAGLVAMPALLKSVGGDAARGFGPAGFMAPPRDEELSDWHRRLGRWFDIGTLYTMLAGMLNVLVVYDALRGPLGSPVGRDPEADEPDGRSPQGAVR